MTPVEAIGDGERGGVVLGWGGRVVREDRADREGRVDRDGDLLGLASTPVTGAACGLADGDWATEP